MNPAHAQEIKALLTPVAMVDSPASKPTTPTTKAAHFWSPVTTMDLRIAIRRPSQ
jgi:hypothetical protein